MEGMSINAYNGLQRYWKRRSYRRLTTTSSSSNPSSTQRKKVRLQLSQFTPHHPPTEPPQPPPPSSSSSSSTRTRRSRFWRWRVKIAPKIRVFRYGYSAARKWLAGIRDAYVKMMMRLASSGGALGGGYGYGGGYGLAGGRAAGAGKEYDERVLVELYKSVLMTERQISAMSTAAAWKKLPERICAGSLAPAPAAATESCGGGGG